MAHTVGSEFKAQNPTGETSDNTVSVNPRSLRPPPEGAVFAAHLIHHQAPDPLRTSSQTHRRVLPRPQHVRDERASALNCRATAPSWQRGARTLEKRRRETHWGDFAKERSVTARACCSDPSGIRTFPGRFDDNRGTTRTCIDCRGVPGGPGLSGRSACARVMPPRVGDFRGVVATTWQQSSGSVRGRWRADRGRIVTR